MKLNHISLSCKTPHGFTVATMRSVSLFFYINYQYIDVHVLYRNNSAVWCTVSTVLWQSVVVCERGYICVYHIVTKILIQYCRSIARMMWLSVLGFGYGIVWMSVEEAQTIVYFYRVGDGLVMMNIEPMCAKYCSDPGFKQDQKLWKTFSHISCPEVSLE